MENSQRKLLYLLEEGVEESEVKLLPKLKLELQELMVGRAGSRRKPPLVLIKNDGCWNWLGFCLDGYGRTKINYAFQQVHRFIYEKLFHKIPDNLQLDHLCRNRKCCNPFHLEVVTLKENVLRGFGITALNLRKTHCKHGHEFNKQNTIWFKGHRSCMRCKVIWQRNKRIKMRTQIARF